MKHINKLLLLLSLASASILCTNSTKITYCADSYANNQASFQLLFPDGTTKLISIARGSTTVVETEFPWFKLQLEGPNHWNPVLLKDSKIGITNILPSDKDYYVSGGNPKFSAENEGLYGDDFSIASEDKCIDPKDFKLR